MRFTMLDEMHAAAAFSSTARAAVACSALLTCVSAAKSSYTFVACRHANRAVVFQGVVGSDIIYDISIVYSCMNYGALD